MTSGSNNGEYDAEICDTLALQTRFSVRSSRFMKAAGIDSERQRSDWFRLRAPLFTTITLPSVKAQSSRPYRWYLFMSDGDQELFDRYVQISEDWIVPIFLVEGLSFERQWRDRIGADFDVDARLYLSRVDNDDALHPSFFSCQIEASKASRILQDHIVVFREGCRWDGSELQRIDYPNNPFLTVVTGNAMHCPFNPLSLNHVKALENPHIFAAAPDGKPMWLQTLHGLNASNKFLPGFSLERPTTSEVTVRFNMSSHCLQAIQLNKQASLSPLAVSEPENESVPAPSPNSEKVDTRAARHRRLNALAQATQAASYLEIGVCTGETFARIDVPRKVGVDPRFRFDISANADPRATFFQKSSNEYFLSEGAQERFDLVFVDGLHTFEQTLIDFNAALVMSHPRSIILIDDTVPTDVYGALPDSKRAFKFRKASGKKSLAWHGDVFKLVVFIHDFFPMLSYATFASGGNKQTVVWREARSSYAAHVGNLEQISRLDYFWLVENVGILQQASEAEILDRIKRWIGFYRE